jgi:hypothetical protein
MKLGTNDIGSVYLGTNAVQKVYLGTNEVWSAFSGGLLDTYSGAAAAYSLRRLSSSYTGKAIRVRRSVGSPSEIDIGFSGENLNIAALESFCSGTDGFVTTWYDQSGNGRDATQTTAANQPQIVSSGAVITLNLKPSLLTNGLSFLKTTSTDFNSLQTSIISVSKLGSGIGGYARLACINVFSNGYYLGGEPSGDKMIGFANSVATPAGGVKYTQNVTWVYNDISNLYLISNNTLIGSKALTMTSYGNQNLFIAAENSTQQRWNGNIQEIIVYPNSQGANINGINANINSFYSIY